MDTSIELVHFQITRNCNLRCRFCGQWGKKGFFSNASGKEMTFDDWKKVMDSLVSYREVNKKNPSVILWGGEPLTCSYFDKIAGYLKENGFKVGLITNGVLINKWIDVINKNIDKIYISVDGREKVHDAVRGQGVYKKVKENAGLIEKKIHKVIMSVLSDELVSDLDEFLKEIAEFSPNEVILQEMIYLTDDETDNYSRWLDSCFNKKATEIFSWRQNKPECLDTEKIKNALKVEYPFNIIYKPHGNKNKYGHCLSAYKHIHITWNGNLIYCTDFYDFSAGNVRNSDVVEIFQNQISAKFREEVSKNHCVTCEHCSWADDETFIL